tara:strand:+ start:20978 stop:21283 length:306 start_codon:yes stop_codon:yes gene_type:complete
MTDPRIYPLYFDEARVIFPVQIKENAVFSYQTPDFVLTEEFDMIYFERQSCGVVCVCASSVQQAVKATIDRLRVRFDDLVEGLSAHQLIHWMAAAEVFNYD